MRQPGYCWTRNSSYIFFQFLALSVPVRDSLLTHGGGCAKARIVKCPKNLKSLSRASKINRRTNGLGGTKKNKRAGNKKNKPANGQKENAKEEKKRKSDKRFFLFLLHHDVVAQKSGEKTRNLESQKKTKNSSQPAFSSFARHRVVHRLFLIQILCNLRARERDFLHVHGMPSTYFRCPSFTALREVQD